jgi:hypothetical protein
MRREILDPQPEAVWDGTQWVIHWGGYRQICGIDIKHWHWHKWMHIAINNKLSELRGKSLNDENGWHRQSRWHEWKEENKDKVALYQMADDKWYFWIRDE